MTPDESNVHLVGIYCEQIRRHLLISDLSSARAHLAVADRQSLASDDQIIMEHVRSALALVDLTLLRLRI